jgi:hypothetical protein
MMTKLKQSLAAIVAKFESQEVKFIDVPVGDMVIRVEGDIIEVGYPIFKVVVDSEGVEQVTPLEDGEYEIEDKIIVVLDGIVAEIKDVEAPEVEEPEVAEEPVSSEFSQVVSLLEKMTSKIEALQSEVNVLKSANEGFKADLDKFAAQPAAPALEVPKKIKTNMSVLDVLKNK